MLSIRKHLLFLLIFILGSGFLHAQNEKKLQKLADKNKYDKLIVKSKKRLKKRKKDAIAYFYLTNGLLLKAENSNRIIQERTYYQATKKYLSYIKYSDSTSVKTDLDATLLELGKNVFSKVSEQNLQKRKYYAEFMASNFNDTIAEYSILFETNPQNQIKSIDIETDISLNSNNSESEEKEKAGFKYSIPKVLPSADLIIKSAESVLGTPWIWSGLNPDKGFDCSGFVIWTFGQNGYELPHKTKILARIGFPVAPGKIKETDIVCFGSNTYNPDKVYHVGIVHSVNNKEVKIIHCGTTKGVSIVPLSSGYWSEVDHFFIRIEK